MLPPASPVASDEMAFSISICASTAFESAMLHAMPDGNPSQFESCADAALSNVISPPPPAKAPLRKSISNGQLENIIG